MKTYLAIPLTVVTLAALLAGGCVSKQQYDELYDKNRKAAAHNQELQGRLNAERAKIAGLTGQLKAANTGKAIAEERIELLQKRNDALEAEMDGLKTELADIKDHKIDVNIGSPLPPEVGQALRAFAEANSDMVEYLPRYGMVKLKADLTFALGSASVKPGAVEALTKLAEIVNAPAAKGFGVYVAGHTDDVPLKRAATLREHKTNWGLSAHRAMAVVTELFRAGVDQPRMAVIGFSKHHPIAPNKPNLKGNAANRRVEIWIVSPNRLLTRPGSAPAMP